MSYELYHGDCLDIMPTLGAGSVDAIITDLPYGTTACAWDTIIPFVPMWEQVKRVLKPNGVFVTTASQPFTSALVMSNPKWFKYDWVWDKVLPTGHLNSKIQPLRRTESIVVFYSIQPTYNPQMKQRDRTRVNKSNGKKFHGNGKQVYGSFHSVDSILPERYPTNVIEISNAIKNDVIHPTQKPIALYEYLIRTYTTPGETVLDFCFGSCTTGVAALRTQRDFIGIERELDYFEIGQKRMAETALQPPLFVDQPASQPPPEQARLME